MARTADTNWPEGYSVLENIMPSTYAEESFARSHQMLLRCRLGSQWVVSIVHHLFSLGFNLLSPFPFTIIFAMTVIIIKLFFSQPTSFTFFQFPSLFHCG